MKEPDEGDTRRREIREAVAALHLGGGGNARRKDRPVTSDLTIDESLILHSIGWEPVDLVCGAGVFSITQGSWQWAVGEITQASFALDAAFTSASRRLEEETSRVGGQGVVGVDVQVSIERHVASVVMVGTAIAPSASRGPRQAPFVSDLSARDFALLHNAGWEARGIAYGVSFVHVPRRSAGTTLQQASQNVELTNFTRAMYSARESAMERMQQSAIRRNANGVVAVQVSEGPMEFARHAIGFTAWGTAVKPHPDGHRTLRPNVVVSMDDAVVTFDVAALRGD